MLFSFKISVFWNLLRLIWKPSIYIPYLGDCFICTWKEGMFCICEIVSYKCQSSWLIIVFSSFQSLVVFVCLFYRLLTDCRYIYSSFSSVDICFMNFDALLLSAYVFRIALPFWWIACFIICNLPLYLL